jgi:hypothetical protein
VFTSTDIPSPVSDRQTNVVQASSSDGREIRFSDPLPSINAQIKRPTRKNHGGERGKPIQSRASNCVITKLKQEEGLTVSQCCLSLLCATERDWD